MATPPPSRTSPNTNPQHKHVLWLGKRRVATTNQLPFPKHSYASIHLGWLQLICVTCRTHSTANRAVPMSFATKMRCPKLKFGW